MSTPQPLWSAEAWKAGQAAYNAILRLPFVTELAAGTLSRERFLRYIAQDSLYLGQYCRVLADIARRTDDPEVRAAFLGFATHGIEVEKSLHASFINDLGSHPAIMSPACLFYTSLLKSMAFEPVEVEAAAILPCFWIYREVGKWIIAHHTAEGNPYAQWINTYSDTQFDESTDYAIALCDKLAASTTPAVRCRMTEIYAHCSRMEWLFWHSAYTNLDYPVEI